MIALAVAGGVGSNTYLLSALLDLGSALKSPVFGPLAVSAGYAGSVGAFTAVFIKGLWRVMPSQTPTVPVDRLPER